MVLTECMICHERPAFSDDLPMCYECAETVVMADDVFPEETHATIKPIAYRIWNLVDDAITETQIDEHYAESELVILVCPDCGRETTDDEEIFCPDCGHGWQPEYENME